MRAIDSCPVCQSDLEKGQEVIDHFGSQEKFELKRCPKCQTLTTSPQPAQNEIGQYYSSNKYISHGDSKGSLFDHLYNAIQKRNLSYKLKLIRKYSLGKTILDFGAGAGAFIQYVHSKGFDTTAIEPDDKARQRIDKNIEKHSVLTQLTKQYDIITAYHVIEHVHQLQQTLLTFKSLLNRNGTIHIALPNYQSYDAQHYQSFWAGYDLPRHLYHFSQKGVHEMISQSGLKLIGTHPLKFDSYYVSLLSEQYKKSNFAPVKAALNGWKSNKKAYKTGEYSSLIYVITN